MELDRLGLDPIGQVPLHGLRRTHATLRVLAGDDVVYVSSQIGHENPTFTLAVYAQAVKHREKLTDAERDAFDEAIEWVRTGAGATLEAPEKARIGTNGDSAVPVPVVGRAQ